jgi:hypothetical protein
MFAPVAQVVLTELTGGLVLSLQYFRKNGVVSLHAHGVPDHSQRLHACPDGIHSGHKVAMPGGARRMRLVIRDHRSFFRKAIDVRRAIPHHTAVVDAEVGEADVISPDDEDIRLLRLRRGGAC